MIGIIWIFLLCGGIIAAMLTGNVANVVPAFFDGASAAVTISIGLVGIMAIWNGLLRLADLSGLLDIVARFFYPVLRHLFPALDKHHKAWAPIMMNISANFLGLGNAATPFGIKAMEELEKTNKNPGTASKEMITFLVMNTSAICIMPGTIIGLRNQLGSTNPTEIIVPALLASVTGLIVALFVSRIIEKCSRGGR